MRLASNALDRLVSFVEDCGGVAPARDAAEHLFAMAMPSHEVALGLLGRLVESDARLAWHDRAIRIEREQPLLFEDTCFVVFDLETTGLAVANARICEIGAVRVRRLALDETFETLVAPGPGLRRVGCLTGVSDQALAAAPGIESALGRFLRFTDNSILVAHNARFDVGFVNQELTRLSGTRLAGALIDTLPLARNLLQGRVERANLASLAFFFGVSAEPCHRALPDALATAEVFIRLLELAAEQGASTVAELVELATPRSRRGRPHRAASQRSI